MRLLFFPAGEAFATRPSALAQTRHAAPPANPRRAVLRAAARFLHNSPCCPHKELLMHARFETILAGLAEGTVVPYLGPGALAGVVDPQSGRAMPADSDSLILAINEGRPMAPKLMYEVSRAAMNVELKRGRSALTR